MATDEAGLGNAPDEIQGKSEKDGSQSGLLVDLLVKNKALREEAEQSKDEVKRLKEEIAKLKNESNGIHNEKQCSSSIKYWFLSFEVLNICTKLTCFTRTDSVDLYTKTTSSKWQQTSSM